MPIAAQATLYTFQPKPNNLHDLDHNRHYTWGIDWTLPAGEHITLASLFIDNINDWADEPNDHLYIHLLDDPRVGVPTEPRSGEAPQGPLQAKACNDSSCSGSAAASG